MNVKSIFILILLAFCWLISWKHYTCSIKGFCGDIDNRARSAATSTAPIQFYLNTDSPLLTNFEPYRDSLCKMSKSSFIEIIGYYYENETNSTPFENLGFARADKLASILNVCKDSMSKLFMKSVLRSGKADSDLLVASEVLISQIPMGLADSKEIQIITTNEVSEIYFPSGSNKELKSDKLYQFLADISMKSGDRRILLTGHTDNVGDESTNVRLSLERCNSIKAILIEMGAIEENIICEGKGSSSPKIDNSTAENRSINRRVELKLD